MGSSGTCYHHRQPASFRVGPSIRPSLPEMPHRFGREAASLRPFPRADPPHRPRFPSLPLPPGPPSTPLFHIHTFLSFCHPLCTPLSHTHIYHSLTHLLSSIQSHSLALCVTSYLPCPLSSIHPRAPTLCHTHTHFLHPHPHPSPPNLFSPPPPLPPVPAHFYFLIAAGPLSCLVVCVCVCVETMTVFRPGGPPERVDHMVKYRGEIQ